MVETFFADGHELYRGYVQVGFKNFNLERPYIKILANSLNLQ